MEAANRLRDEFKEDHYKNAPDAHNMLELSPDALRVKAEGIWVLASKTPDSRGDPGILPSHTAGQSVPHYEERIPNRAHPFSRILSKIFSVLALLFLFAVVVMFILSFSMA